MKRILLASTLILVSLISNSQNFEVETLKLSGETNKRINLVILSEGYQSSEFDKFKTDATSFMTDMFTQSPFKEYTNYFNVYIIKVPSNESGSDHPGTASDVSEPASPITTADTYFNTSYDSFGTHRLLYSSDYATISTVLANNFPEYDQSIVLVNSDVYGGSGGTFPFTSTGTSANEIAIHELGHSMFDLKDEYYPGDALAAEAINMTQETNPSLVKWKNWIGTNNIGIYPYASSGNAANWNRPHQTCKMRYLGYDFCAVCKEGMIEKIHDLVAPIDSYNPVSNTLEPNTFPVNFGLNLIKPVPNTLESTWTLNSNNVANNVDELALEASDFNEGENTLTAVVFDNSPMLKIDNHNTIHASTVTWKINYSSLGIEDMTTKENSFNIEMYPNPTENTINFTFKNRNNSTLKIEIATIDGKIINSTSVANLETKSIDISPLQSGIYLANFYTDNAFVGSKKIVKQ
ncbi:peptidase M64 [Tamlana nanhaiensis]|uniref:Peptidase M64 n=1 Tax=Neotamlana nanhaiensis TaxID=1382798 RepID=A0A0D7VYJ6_9FLAO|nr:M64 family metallopeptidase [Tamlana nanhaiensis]KJD31513.1 peptidase M64 [Tamlana nanhaiensis]